MSLTGVSTVAPPNRRVVVTCAAFAVVASLGLVTNLSGQLLGPITARTQPLSIALILLVPLVGMAVLWRYPRTAWAWLLLAGAVLAMPATVLPSGSVLGPVTLGGQLLVVSTLI